MSLEEYAEPTGSAPRDVNSPSQDEVDEQQSQLSDAELQAHYRAEYLTQLRRQSCPGCGEDFSMF